MIVIKIYWLQLYKWVDFDFMEHSLQAHASLKSDKSGRWNKNYAHYVRMQYIIRDHVKSNHFEEKGRKQMTKCLYLKSWINDWNLATNAKSSLLKCTHTLYF